MCAATQSQVSDYYIIILLYYQASRIPSQTHEKGLHTVSEQLNEDAWDCCDLSGGWVVTSLAAPDFPGSESNLWRRRETEAEAMRCVAAYGYCPLFALIGACIQKPEQERFSDLQSKLMFVSYSVLSTAGIWHVYKVSINLRVDSMY